MTGYPDIELYIDGRWKQRGAASPCSIRPTKACSARCRLPRSPISTMRSPRPNAASRSGARPRRPSAPQIILKAASLMRERVDEMAVAMTLEQGKPLEQARLEILRGCDIIEWDATEGLRVYGRVIPSEPGMRHTVLRQPIGPVAAFSPWNFPMSSPARKIARRAVGRLLDHPQGVGGDAGRRGAAGARLPRCRPAAGRAQSRVRQSGRDFRAI